MDAKGGARQSSLMLCENALASILLLTLRGVRTFGTKTEGRWLDTHHQPQGSPRECLTEMSSVFF